MADINLLQSNHPRKAPEGGAVPNSLNYIGAGILVIVVILSAALWYLAGNVKKQDDSILAQTQQTKHSVTSMPSYKTFVSEQNSLKGLSFLVQNHQDWSLAVPKIAGVTLKTAAYSSITLNQDGTATLQGTIPSYADLDRYMQALNDKKISPFITSATLLTVSTASANASSVSSNTPSSSTAGLTFTVAITFDKTIWSSITTPAKS